MIQLYFLSVLCNSLSGYILYSENEGENPLQIEAFKNPTFILVLGILSIVTGVLKILSPAKTLIFGDLLPAAGGIIGGFMMLFGIKRGGNVVTKTGSLEALGTSLMRYKKPLGLGLLAAAILHFLFPEALFL